jgi:outer membrane protein OmpA-like peptidoglycan-associated protein
MNIKMLSLLLAILLLPFWAVSQSLEKVLETGDEAYKSRDYFTAFQCYEVVLDYDDDKYSRPRRLLAYQYGLSAQRFNYFSKADSVFANLMVASEDNNLIDSIYARTVYYRAQLLLSKGESSEDYLLAQQLFEKVADELASKVSANPVLQDRYREAALAGVEKVEYSLQRNGWIGRDTLHRLTSEKVNSAYSDLAPMLKGDTLFFSSLRFDSNPLKRKRQSTTYAKNLRAVFSPLDTSGMDTVLTVLATNGVYNEEDRFTLHRATSPSGEWMVFSLCGQVEDSIRCQLYKRRDSGQGKWGEPQLMSINAGSNYTTTQPAFGYDCSSGAVVLYFASDRTGSLGGLDIWQAEFDEASGAAKNVTNLGVPVNSAWNEGTPFYHQLSSTLYFSSDAPPGYGLYDLFKSLKSENGWSQPVNLGAPYNTGFNDMYFFAAKDGETIYLSSDRPRSKRFDEAIDACCQDIFTGRQPIDRELIVEVIQCDKKPVGYTPSQLQVIDVSDCRQLDTLINITSMEDIAETLSVKKYRQYRVLASNASIGISIDTIIDLRQPHYDTAQVATVVADLLPDYLELAVSTGFYLDGGLIEIGDVTVEDYSGNQLEEVNGQAGLYRLSFDKAYNVGITVDSTERTIQGVLPGIITLYPDTLEGIYFPKTKCQRVCYQEISIPLPADQRREVRVYFHNDKPNRAGRVPGGFRGYTSVTDQNFEDAIDEYLGLAPTYYKNNPNRDTIQNRIRRFFNNEVDEGKDALDTLSQNLIVAAQALDDDQFIQVEIQGLCSARGNKIYNDSLAIRRIQCIREYMEKQESGGVRLGDFMGPENSNAKVRIKSLPLGESEASGNFPGGDENGKYNIGASLDRRVELKVVLPEQKAPEMTVFDLDEDCTQTNNETRKNPEQ